MENMETIIKLAKKIQKSPIPERDLREKKVETAILRANGYILKNKAGKYIITAEGRTALSIIEEIKAAERLTMLNLAFRKMLNHVGRNGVDPMLMKTYISRKRALEIAENMRKYAN